VVSLGGTRRRFPGDESGFTLPEVLVAMTMMVTVLFALYALFDTSVRIFRYGGDELEALENARLGLERMEREIRAAYPHDGGVLLDIGGTDGISFQNMPDSGPPRTITYSLSGGPESYLRRNGQRLVGPLDGEEGLRFAYCATPTDCSSPMTDEAGVRLVRITLNARVPGATDATRTLTTDVYLRNREASP
jgi:prepilin-type N-terminal cleavage/methylation domain-containing protein